MEMNTTDHAERALSLKRDCDGLSNIALFEACSAGDREVAAYLIQHLGADVNRRERFCRGTPLHAALGAGHLELALLLVKEFGANVAVACSEGNNALHEAAVRGADAVRLLVAEIGDTAETRTALEARNTRGFTPLHVAARTRSVSAVRALLAAGADVRATDSDGRTALHYAIRAKRREMVLMLVNEFGADINARTNDGRTPLYIAVGFDFLEIARLLVRMGADVEAKTREGVTPLIEAVGIGPRRSPQSLAVTRFLFEETGADISAVNADGRTPLHLATFCLSEEAVRVLVTEFGAPVDAKDKDGNTPLHLAAMDSLQERTVRTLSNHCGALVGAKNNEGWTPLHCAANGGHDRIVRILSKNCPEGVVDTADNKGKTLYIWLRVRGTT